MFDSDRSVVFDCWVKPDVFEKWYPPAECESRIVYSDVREGGYSQQEDRWPDGTHCYIKHVYKTVNPVDELAFISSFCTADGEIVSHPFAALWPKQMLTTLAFEQEGAGTKVSVLWEPVEASEEEIAFFTKILPSCQQGWTGTFGRLEAFLQQLNS